MNNTEDFTYSSTQATKCAGCGQYKHTPLRNDRMDGYVCLTCIDKELQRLQSSEQGLEGVLTMTVARLAGTVEGAPTNRGNFLQRIDELRGLEQKLSSSEQSRERLVEALWKYSIPANWAKGEDGCTFDWAATFADEPWTIAQKALQSIENLANEK